MTTPPTDHSGPPSESLENKDHAKVAGNRQSAPGNEMRSGSSGSALGPAAAEASGMPRFSDRYKAETLVARGGTGAVLKVRDTHLQREIAIKVVLRMYRDNREVCRRFIKEACITSRLQHPGILPIYELGLLAD
jgi:eukaryotic-like serine/threonine-protein kinase